jgi:hypothetical protein
MSEPLCAACEWEIRAKMPRQNLKDVFDILMRIKADILIAKEMGSLMKFSKLEEERNHSHYGRS